MRTLLALALLLAALTPLRGQPSKAPEATLSPPPAQTPAPAAKVWTAEEVLDEARRIEQHADDEVSQIAGLMGNFIAVLGVVILVLLGVALQEWRVVREKMDLEIRRARAEADAVAKAKTDAETTLAQVKGTAEQYLKAAEESRDKVDAALKQADVTAAQIAVMYQGVKDAWKVLGPELKKLPAVEAAWIVGGEGPDLPPDLKATLEDYDILLIVSDRLGIGIEDEPEKTFLRFAQYWRIARKFPRALKRGERAIELSSADDPDGRFQLGITLSHWAAYERENPTPERNERLQRALSLYGEVRRLQGRDTADLLYEMAWTLDEMQRSEESIELARKACETLEKDPGQMLQKEPWEYPYNLACYLAKAGRFEEAMAELEKLAGHGTKWVESAAEDGDFDGLRNSPEWRNPFDQILENGRKRAS